MPPRLKRILSILWRIVVSGLAVVGAITLFLILPIWNNDKPQVLREWSDSITSLEVRLVKVAYDIRTAVDDTFYFLALRG
jgi:hypothetical protein